MGFALTLNPEVEDQLRKVAQAEHRSVHKTVDSVEEAMLRIAPYVEAIAD